MDKGEQMMVDGWNKLGFYYDFDGRICANQWKLYGSKEGLGKFVKLLAEFATNDDNDAVGIEEHIGPYSYLTIMTWHHATIMRDYFHGTLQDFKRLSDIIDSKLAASQPGQTFTIHEDYGIDNKCTVRFFIMADDFDPSSIDELIQSNRQKFVNEQFIKE